MKEWVIDIGMPMNDDIVVFVPYDRENDVVMIGTNYVSAHCPGELIGIVDTSKSTDEEMKASYEAFVEKHPNWRLEFCKR